MAKILFALFGLALLTATVAAADCSASAYRNACAGCSFDANGKIDQECMKSKKGAGIACVSASYPLSSAAYAAGKCPQIDACASELSSCTAQYSSGNDKADCAEGSVSVCYSASDQCVRKAAMECGDRPAECKVPAALIMLVGGVVSFAGFARKA